MLVKVYGAAVQGIDATIVTIEVNSSRGIKFFLYLANLHTSFLCNLIYPTFSRILLYSC